MGHGQSLVLDATHMTHKIYINQVLEVLKAFKEFCQVAHTETMEGLLNGA